MAAVHIHKRFKMSESLVQQLARLDKELKEVKKELALVKSKKPEKVIVNTPAVVDKQTPTIDKKTIAKIIDEVVTEPYITNLYRNK